MIGWINLKKNGFKEDLFKHLINVCNECLNILKDIINKKYQNKEIDKNLYDKLINACINQALNQKQYFDEVSKNGGFAWPMRKIIIIFTLTILLTGCASPVNNQTQNKDNNITVQEIYSLMLEDLQQVIIIDDNNIIYRGEPDKIDQDLLKKSVVEIANTEDNYNNDSITLIIE